MQARWQPGGIESARIPFVNFNFCFPRSEFAILFGLHLCFCGKPKRRRLLHPETPSSRDSGKAEMSTFVFGAYKGFDLRGEEQPNLLSLRSVHYFSPKEPPILGFPYFDQACDMAFQLGCFLCRESCDNSLDIPAVRLTGFAPCPAGFLHVLCSKMINVCLLGKPYVTSFGRFLKFGIPPGNWFPFRLPSNPSKHVFFFLSIQFINFSQPDW